MTFLSGDALNFLVTNDDGWGTHGLQCLRQAASEFGNVWVVAPAEPQSGVSHRLTRSQPLRLVEVGKQSFTLSGTPVDCARIALTQLDIKFDYVFSGVNHGANLGADSFISGTLAAARESVILGVPGVAFSQYRKRFREAEFDWEPAKFFTKQFIENLLAMVADGTPLLSVNFPDLDGGSNVTEVKVVECELDRNPLPTIYARDENNDFVYKGVYADRKRTPGRDVDLCLGGAVTVTRHHI